MNAKLKNAVELRPIGNISSAYDSTEQVSLLGSNAVIEVFPEYEAALERISENSHLWILSWFHEARRDVLATVPGRVNPNLPRYGVFGLRSPSRPNPIALTLVQLDGVVENRLFIRGMDAVDGTPVLDIKPYYERDIVFSPRTPQILPASRPMKKDTLEKEAVAHHRENCADLKVAVRMALFVQERWGKLNDDELYLEITGSACLADVLQGLSRARLANPPRFHFYPSGERMCSLWRKGEGFVSLTLRDAVDLKCIDSLSDDQLFRIEAI